MKILAIDTSSKNAAVVITENEEELVELNNSEEKTHSQKLMPMIDEALKKADLSLDEINLIVCCLGPGSFTGVRIGIATAKAFADSKNIPLVGVSSLEELAYNLNTEGYICSLIDAGHGNTYTGIFEVRKDENGRFKTVNENLTFLNLIDEDGKITDKKLVKFLQKSIEKNTVNSEQKIIHFVGDGVINYKELIKNIKYDDFEIRIATDNQNISSGISLAKIGYTKYKNGQYGDSSILSPIYLRKSQAELALEEKK